MKQTATRIKVTAMLVMGLALLQLACSSTAPVIATDPSASLASNKVQPRLAPDRQQPAAEVNRPTSVKDLLRDPTNPVIHLFQNPTAGMAGLPADKSDSGVNWVKALDIGAITPRRALHAPGTGVEVEELVMDLDMYLNVSGSMPIVRFPHRAHTMWLACANCHQAPVTNIFVPQAGANNISMEKILMGEQCGICHSAVAFSINDCSRCHSVQHSSAEGMRAKEQAQARAMATGQGWRP